MPSADATYDVQRAYAQLWGACAGLFRQSGRRPEPLYANPEKVRDGGGLVMFAYPGVVYGWSRRHGFALEQRGDTAVAFRPDGTVIWAVRGPAGVFFEAAMMAGPSRPWRN